MELSRHIRLWNCVSATVLVVALVGSIATGQTIFRHPQPGDIYREYSRTMMAYSEWRVTDPNAPRPSIPPSYLINEVLPISISDLSGAIRAEAVIDLWQGHAGTTGKKMRINGHSWITIPELTSTPGPGQCWFSQFNVVVDVPLSNLVEGTNYFEGSNEGQTCYDFGWGQHGWNGIIFRIYYNSSKAHPTGAISSPTSGGSFGDYPSVSATASGGAGIQRVDFLAYYEGLDTDGDGEYTDWHYYYHRTKSEVVENLKGHVGTDYTAPYEVTWNTDDVPDQASGAVKLIARIQDNSGIWFVTDPVDNLTLARSGTSVKMYKSYDVPQEFDVRNYVSKRSHFDIPAGADLSNATYAKVVLSAWNALSGGKQPSDNYYYRVNDWYAPEFGEDHFYSLDYFDIGRWELHTGQNFFEIYSESQSTEIFVHWPGPQVIVRYGNVPVPVQISSFTATPIGAEGVRLEWTTLSETNNYGFEVQKSTSDKGPYTTVADGFVKGNGTTVVPHNYSFTDPAAAFGIFYFRLKQIDLNGTQHLTDPVRVDVTTGVVGSAVPTRTMLAQNYPNPFNPSTVIRFGVAEKSQVTLSVFNALGEKVATLVNDERMPGYYDVRFTADGIAAGVYFYRITAGSFVQTNKLILLR
jgi:hypothetical protein